MVMKEENIAIMQRNIQNSDIIKECNKILKLIRSPSHRDDERELLYIFLQNFTNLSECVAEEVIFIPKIELKCTKFSEVQNCGNVASLAEVSEKARDHFRSDDFVIWLDLSDLNHPFFDAKYKEEPGLNNDYRPAQYKFSGFGNN